MDKNNQTKTEDNTDNKKSELKQWLWALVGVAVSAASIFLYHTFANTVLAVILCAICTSLGLFSIHTILKSGDERYKINIFHSIIIMLGYWVLLFVCILVFTEMVLDLPFSASLCVYPFLLTPAYVIVNLLIGILGMGI